MANWTENDLAALHKRLGAHRVRLGSKGRQRGAGQTQPSQRKPSAAKKAVGDINAQDLAAQIRAAGLPEPVLEYRFSRPRRHRADLAYPERKLLIEIDGAVHRIKSRFHGDLEKSQIAFALGFNVLRVSPKQVRNGEALNLLDRALTATTPSTPQLNSAE